MSNDVLRPGTLLSPKARDSKSIRMRAFALRVRQATRKWRQLLFLRPHSRILLLLGALFIMFTLLVVPTWLSASSYNHSSSDDPYAALADSAPAYMPGNHSTGLAPFVPADADRPVRIILLVPAVEADANATRGLPELLSALQAAHYTTGDSATPARPVTLDVVLAPDADPVAARARWELCRASEWTHGEKKVRNASSGGHYDFALDAWTPARSDPTLAVLIDAAVAAPPGQDFFRILHTTRREFAHHRTELAGVAVQPVRVRRRDVREGRPHPDFANVDVASVGKGDAGVFLYQVLAPDVGIFSPYDADVWRGFQRWFAARRSEWFLWPVVVAPKDKRDPTWNAYRGTLRAPWRLWFTRYCAEQQLYTMYPVGTNPQPLPVGFGSQWLPLVFDYNGQRVEQKLSINRGSLRRILSLGVRGGGSVSMTVVNKAFIATAKSWVCNVDVAGVRPPGVVWMTTDIEAREAMERVANSETVHLSELKGGQEHLGTSYGSPGYWLLMLERTRLIREILDHGIGVFAFETDQIWLRDPVPYVQRLVNGGDEVDVVGTLDTRHEIGGNFLYLNPTLATKALWREVTRRFEESYYSSQMDQRQRPGSKPHFIENDQSLLTKLVFFEESFKQRNPVVFRALDTELFVDGRWYEYPKVAVYNSPRARSPVLINNNFLVGIAAKKRRAELHGHWFLRAWDGDGDTCSTEAVVKAVRENEKRASGGNDEDSRVVRPMPDLEARLDMALNAIARGLGK